MSENQENSDTEVFEEKPTKVEITVKKDEKSKSLEQQLEDAKTESEDFKSKLELIAEKEFERRRREANAPEDIDTPEKLQGFITATKKKGEPAGNIPLTPEQMGDVTDKVNSAQSVHDMSFDSYMEMLGTLEARSKMGDDEARKVLGQLAEKNIHTSSTFEFEGELFKNVQKPRSDKRSEEEIEEEKSENSRKWKRKR